MPRKLWLYNYDFEFELANLPPVKLHQSKKAPWWYLNRSSVLLTPLTDKDDAILVYQYPSKTLIEKYHDYFQYLPDFIKIQPADNESNSILRDYQATIHQPDKLDEFRLCPWGWSPSAIALAKHQCANTFPANFKDTVIRANSKETSDFIRASLIPKSFLIPSLQIKNQSITSNSLISEINRFISEFSKVKIKHYFGASGKLTDSIIEKKVNPKRLSRWLSWIRQSGGILLEQVLDIDSEYSIQAELDKQGRTEILTMTRMFSNSNGSYLGNLLDLTEKDALVDLKESLKPLFSFLAKIGYYGPVGLDLLKTRDGELKLIEINARLTMGRIAYEWNRMLNSRRFGFFGNFFLKSAQFPNLPSFLDYCLLLEKKFDCTFSIINAVPSTQGPISLITILVGANTKDLLTNLLSQLYPPLFQRVKL